MGLDGVLNYERSVEGTVVGNTEQRIIAMDGFTVDIPPEGHILFFNHADRPGILHSISSALAASGGNIAHFSLGRKEKGANAMGAILLDAPLDTSAFTGVEGIHNLTQVDMTQNEIDSFFKNAQDNLPPRPRERPVSPEFSSGPCKKRPGWTADALDVRVLGRSHRSKLGKERLALAIAKTKAVLGVPEDYHVGIVPASDTGAYEMAMWSMLGARPIDACYWESFGEGWKADAISHLGLKDTTRVFTAEYGELPDLSQTNPDHDILFTFNGTTSGVRVPNLDWIDDNRTGLTFNDATSAAFAMDIDWSKCDVTTYSWQKVLGGEGAHGVMILSPRAVERLESFTPENRPLPKIFRLAPKGKFAAGVFKGETINTPSMLCVEDYIDALIWTESEGGVPGLIKRSETNLSVLEKFVALNDWIEF